MRVLIYQITAAIFEHLKIAVAPITVTGYRTKVVAGLHYDVAITIGGASYTVEIFKPLAHTGKAPHVLKASAADAAAAAPPS